MPLYEYECARCGERIEVIRSFDDPPLTVCPDCGGALTKLLSSPAFQFKGSGFYLTDYGKSGSSQAGEKEKRSSAKAEEGKAGGGAAEAAGGGTGESKKGSDSSKGEKTGRDSSRGKSDGAASAEKASPGAAPPPAPSKKKSGDTK